MKRTITALNYATNSPVELVVENGIITAVNKVTHWDGELPFVAPGLIDNQVNGFKGIDFSSNSLKPSDVECVVTGLWKAGVTTFLPTIITNSFKRILDCLTVLSRAQKSEVVSRAIPGYHLEGPYISPQDGYRGAHQKRYVRNPDWDEFCRWQEAAEGKILQVSLAPELDGAVPFIKKCVKSGIVISLAHHAASNEQIDRAIDAGARLTTHLGNGCANMIHRRENVLWPQLANDRLTATMICDGFHLTPEMVKVFYRAKTHRRIILTSDMTLLAGQKPGEYVVDGQKMLLEKNGRITLPSQKVLAGASLTLNRNVEKMIRFSGCPLRQAVDMASRNVAHIYSLKNIGQIAKGKRADLLLFSFDGESLRIRETIVAGESVLKRK